MIYISPPFGTWFHPNGSLPVLGSFTPSPRPGRFSQIIKTLRPTPGGWINAIGLCNKGINNLIYKPNVIYSLSGVREYDWEIIYHMLEEFQWPEYNLELNLSCPNIETAFNVPKPSTFRLFTHLSNANISVKLPPDESFATKLITICLNNNINFIHLSNTFPTPHGGISGQILREINLPIVESISKQFPQAQIIAGGGIYILNHYKQYQSAGAKHFSLGTVFFNPIKGLRLFHQIQKRENLLCQSS